MEKYLFCPIVEPGKKWSRQHKGLWLNNLLVELWYCTLSIASLLRHVTSNLAYLHNGCNISLKLYLHICLAAFSKDIYEYECFMSKRLNVRPSGRVCEAHYAAWHCDWSSMLSAMGCLTNQNVKQQRYHTREETRCFRLWSQTW